LDTGVAAGIDASFYLISKILGQDWAKTVAKNLEYPYSARENLTHNTENCAKPYQHSLAYVIINLKSKIMTHTYSVTGMMCKGCASHVKEQIENHPDVTLVDISPITLVEKVRRRKEAVISMNQHISITELQRFLDQDSQYSGRYSIS